MNTVRTDVRALIDMAWPGLAHKIEIADSLGIHWEEISTPFTRYENGKLVCHVGTFTLPVAIEGQKTEIGIIHAVCTHPEFQRKGFARSTLIEAISHLQSTVPTIALFTEIPDFYRPFGFRPVQTYAFRQEVLPIRPIGGLRKLSSESQSDMALLKNIFSNGMPASNIYSPRDNGGLLLINEVLGHGQVENLYYAEDLELILAYEIEGKLLKLFDFAAKQDIPTLSEIVARTGENIESVLVCFTPDRFSKHFQKDFAIEPGNLGVTFMVRDKFGLEGQFFGVSPLWQA